MADDDFDIDIYGDTIIDDDGFRKDYEGDVKIEGLHDDNDVKDVNDVIAIHTSNDIIPIHPNNDVVPIYPDDMQDLEDHYDDYIDIKVGGHDRHHPQERQKIKSTDEPNKEILKIPKKAPQQQGVKRKGAFDERIIDPGATSALLISDLHWWNTDDDIRGWVNQAQCEDELKEMTFSEHKINGKSKGQAYIQFASQQAATAAKHQIDTFGEGQYYVKKHTVTYSNPSVNPFKTLPKDAPLRDNKGAQTNQSSSGGHTNRSGQSSNYRGRGSNHNQNRGNGSNPGGGNYNRNFSAPHQMGTMSNGFQATMGGYQGSQMGNHYGGFNRGGMAGGMRGGANNNMRGGRGGIGNGMIGGIPVGGMPMGGMGGTLAGMVGPMGMGQMGGGMQGGGYQVLQPHFNPAFFQPNQPIGGDWQNPHGAKRHRPE